MLAAGFGSLVVRWLIAVVVYFGTFVVLMDVFLMGADWSMILKGAVLFSLVVSTVSIFLMRKKNTKSLPFYDTIFASGIAGLLLVGAMSLEDQAIGGWSLSSLWLMGITVGIGVAGRWVYATVTSGVHKVIREWSAEDGGR